MFNNLESSTIEVVPSSSASDNVESIVLYNENSENLWVESNNNDPNNPIKFICLWAQCYERFNSVPELESHLEEHYEEYKTILSDGIFNLGGGS